MDNEVGNLTITVLFFEWNSSEISKAVYYLRNLLQSITKILQYFQAYVE